MRTMKRLKAAALLIAATFALPTQSQTRLWGSYYGGEAGDSGNDVAVDGAGNVYVAGDTNSGMSIATPTGFDQTLDANSSAFLAKFDGSGHLVWSTYYDDLNTTVVDLGVDAAGNVYLLGNVGCPSSTLSTANAHQSLCPGDYAMFLVKFDPFGKRVWSTYYGVEDGFAAGSALSVAPSGHIYLAGIAQSAGSVAGLIPGGSVDANFGGQQDGVVAKFDPRGRLLWARLFGGEAMDWTSDIACSIGSPAICYVTGTTNSQNEIATAGAHDVQLSGFADSFLLRLSGLKGETDWSTYYGGGAGDNGRAVTIGADMGAVMAGDTLSPDEIATPDADDASYGGGGKLDAFLVKFNAAGQRKAGTYYGGTGTEGAMDLAADAAGNVYLFAAVSSLGLDTPGAYDSNLSGTSDASIAKFDTALIRKWSTYYGGNGAESGGGIAIDTQGHMYVTGYTSSSGDMTTPGTHKPVFQNADAFLAEFSP